jgi:excisionase family DNA binding protein
VKKSNVVALDKDWWNKDREPSPKPMAITKRVKVSSRYWTPKEISDQIGIALSTVYELIASKELRAARIGRTYRVANEDLEAYLTKCSA